MNEANFFEVDFEDGKIRVQRHSISSQVIYRVIFSDGRAPLVVTRALRDSLEKFWTSIPEGRQLEAEQVGPLIQKHYNSLS